MSTEPLSDDQRAFAQHVAALITRDPSRINFAAIAAEANQRGLFAPDEVMRCQRGSIVPAWLAEAVGGPLRPLEPGRLTTMPAPFGEGSRPVTMVEAGPVRLAVHNFNRLALTADGLVTELSAARGRWLAPHIAAAQDVPHLAGTTVDAVVEGGPLYSHFLFDALPKLIALKTAVDLDGVDNVLLASTQHPFHREALARIGIDPARCRTRQQLGSIVDVDRVLWVAPLRQAFAAPAALYQAVKDLFAPEAPDPAAPRRVYISRSKAARRRILNEEALLPVFAARGYQVVHFEDLGVAGAAALLHQAEHIVGLHGAGFANIAFAPPGCRVTEIHGPHFSPEYRIISGIMGLSHDTFDCGTVTEGFEGDFFRTNAADVVVPEDVLKGLLLD